MLNEMLKTQSNPDFSGKSRILSRKKYLILVFLFVFVSANLFAQGAGNCLDFDGTDGVSGEYVEITNGSAMIANQSAITFECWIYPRTVTITDWTTDFEGFVGIRNETNDFYITRISNTGLNCRFRISSGTYYDVDGTVTANEWQHYALVYNGSSLMIYRNGILEDETSASGQITDGTIPLRIGKQFYSSYHWPLDGKIDEVRVWTTGRTAAQIRENMCTTIVGDENGLVAYYKMTDGSGASLTDNSTNSNTGTLTNMDDNDWVTSGAALGDASAYDYSTPTSVNFASDFGDDVTVGTIVGSPDGVQIYRVDSAPNVTTPPSGLDQLSQSHYFGVFIAGGTTPTYTLTYNYEGHPGVSNENNLELASRGNNATASWTDLNATLNTTDNTLIKTDQTGTEYIIASTGENPLPVNLSSFYALYIGGTPTLYWTTQTETDNAYWNVYRGTCDNFEEAAHINANNPIAGNGTTNSASDYIYTDVMPIVQNTTYWYWIEDVSTDGETEVHEPINLSIPFEDTPVTPEDYGLHQNYPNPFNPSTSISFALAEESDVELIIYNIKGEKIKSIFNDHIYADQITTAVWDGKDANGKDVSTGVYFYKLITDTKEYQNKMLMVK